MPGEQISRNGHTIPYRVSTQFEYNRLDHSNRTHFLHTYPWNEPVPNVLRRDLSILMTIQEVAHSLIQ